MEDDLLADLFVASTMEDDLRDDKGNGKLSFNDVNLLPPLGRLVGLKGGLWREYMLSRYAFTHATVCILACVFPCICVSAGPGSRKNLSALEYPNASNVNYILSVSHTRTHTYTRQLTLTLKRLTCQENSLTCAL